MSGTCGCTRPIQDQACVCRSCVDTVRVALRDVPWLVRELTTTLTRQSSRGDGPKRPGGETPLPYDARASEVAHIATNTLTTWSEHVTEATGTIPPTGGSPMVVAAAHIAAHLDWVRMRPEAVGVVDEVTHIVGLMLRTIDLPPSYWELGPCGVGECVVWLKCATDTRQVTCRCGATHDVTARRAETVRRADDQLVTAAEATRIIRGALGVPIGDDVVYALASHGRLTPHGMAGAKLYRFGDVVAAVMQARTRPARRVALTVDQRR